MAEKDLPKVDLSLVPLTELCDEVCNRASSAIVMVIMPNDPENMFGYHNWKGDYYKALGICSEMEELIKDYAREKN